MVLHDIAMYHCWTPQRHVIEKLGLVRASRQKITRKTVAEAHLPLVGHLEIMVYHDKMGYTKKNGVVFSEVGLWGANYLSLVADGEADA